jgi:hypothetical protein
MNLFSNLILISIMTFVSLNAHSAPLEEMAKRLAELRAEVEEKGIQVEVARKRAIERTEPLRTRKSELEALIRKERLRSIQLEEKHAVLRTKLKKDFSNSGHQDLDAWAKQLEFQISASMPFRRAERAAKISTLRKRIAEKRESPVTLAIELWTLTEAELRFGADNEFRIMKLPELGDKDAEVARIGAMQLLYRIPGGREGYLVREKGSWHFRDATVSSEKKSISRVIEKFKNKSYSGWFEIPLGGTQ